MELDEFTEEVVTRLQKELESGRKAEKLTISGLNGTKRHSVLICGAGSGVAPCVNMETYHGRHRDGENIESLLEKILSDCLQKPPIGIGEIAGFTRWDSIRPHIFAKLVNTEKNEDLLREAPHRHCLDLSLTYYARIKAETPDMFGSIQIRNEHMKLWDVTETDLFQTANENMEKADNMLLEDIADVLRTALNTDIFPGETEPPQMYVLGNKDRVNGAVQMCRPQALQKAAETIGGDFWVLPSSIHELVLLPLRHAESGARDLAEIVREVNDTRVEPQEILSYHVYLYKKSTGKLEIAG